MSDLINKLLDGDGEAATPVQKNPLVAMLLDGDAKSATPTPNPLIPKLVSAAPLARQEKQKGAMSVIMLTPYRATEMKGLIKALAEINKKLRIGKVYFEGAPVIGRKLPRLVPKYDIITCVRDIPTHLQAFKNLGGSGRHRNPMEEVRERLDDEDRLLRRDEEQALEDMIEMAGEPVTLVVMPGSSRMALAENIAVSHNIAIVQASKQSGIDYIDDIEAPQPPVTLLVVTPEDYTDVGALIAARTHLAYLGRKIGKIIHTPSMAMEVIAGLKDGTICEEIDTAAALQMPFMLFDGDPDYAIIAGNTPLAAATLNMAEHRNPKVPCAELP